MHKKRKQETEKYVGKEVDGRSRVARSLI